MTALRGRTLSVAATTERGDHQTRVRTNTRSHHGESAEAPPRMGMYKGCCVWSFLWLGLVGREGGLLCGAVCARREVGGGGR